MEQKPAEFYTSHKISTSFKIFISIFVVTSLLVFGYFLLQQGERLSKVITLFFAVIGAVALFVIGGRKRLNDFKTYRIYLLLRRFTQKI